MVSVAADVATDPFVARKHTWWVPLGTLASPAGPAVGPMKPSLDDVRTVGFTTKFTTTHGWVGLRVPELPITSWVATPRRALVAKA